MVCGRSAAAGDEDWDEDEEAEFLMAVEERLSDPHLLEGGLSIEEAFGVDAKCARRRRAHRPVRFEYGEPTGRGRLSAPGCRRRAATERRTE
jgi:hypothetical protein